MRTFTEALLMRLPIPVSRLLLGVDNTSNPHHRKELLRKLNPLLNMFERELKLRSQMVWHVSCLSDFTPIILNSWGKEMTLHVRAMGYEVPPRPSVR
jgi:hypothetical protein